MEELKGHVYHKNRKWRCPRCGRASMQKPRGRSVQKARSGKTPPKE